MAYAKIKIHKNRKYIW